MQGAEQVRDILMMELIGLQAKNPHYSMRAYSKKVGIPQSAISEIIRKKRNVTSKMASKILRGLDYSPMQIKEIIDNFNHDKSPKISGKLSFKPLQIDTFNLIAEWYHFAILSLTETKNFKSEPQWIAQRLGISENQAREAIDRLLRLEMLAEDPKTKKLRPTGTQYQIDPGIATPALKRACRENIDLVSGALDSTRFDERDFTAITLCFNPRRMAEAKRMIKHFRQRFSQQMECGEKTEVYKLVLQLFPLSKNGALN